MPLAALGLIFALVVLSFGEGCGFRPYGPKSPLVGHKQFLSCLLSVRFNSKDAKETLTTLQRSVPLYSFVDVVKDSPGSGLPKFKVDILADLEKVNQNRYNVDADFQQDLANVFLQLRDPHTCYSKPKECYSVFAIQPLIFGSKMVNNRQIIYVSSVVPALAADPLYANIHLQSFVGAEVTEIDYDDALSEIKAYAKAYGYISKVLDDGSAFNWALSNGYQQRSMELFPAPTSPFQYLQFKRPNGTIGNVQIPWGFLFTEGINYTANGCKIDGIPQAASKGDILASSRIPARTMRLLMHQQTLTGDADMISIIKLSNDVVVLRIASFSTNDPDLFIGVLHQLLNMAKQNQTDNLIIDVRSNYGGSICLGYQTIQSLAYQANPMSPYDLIHSPLMDLFVSHSDSDTPLTGSDNWIQKNGAKYPNASWYTLGPQRVRGGVRATYSQPAYLTCNVSSRPPAFQFKKILILSDGLCGSTCAIFTSHLSQLANVRTVTIGGYEGQPQQPYSFPGGNVMDNNDISFLALLLELGDHPLVPPLFPTYALFRFTWLEAYPWGKTDTNSVPLEFVFSPSDFRMSVWLDDTAPFAEVVALYKATAKYFDSSTTSSVIQIL